MVENLSMRQCNHLQTVPLARVSGALEGAGSSLSPRTTGNSNVRENLADFYVEIDDRNISRKESKKKGIRKEK